MNKKYALLLFTLLPILLWAQTHHQAAHVKESFVKVKDRVYACKYETTNGDYQVFFADISNRRPSLTRTLLQDTAKWANALDSNLSWQKNYHKDKKYANYPLLNISYDQAYFYCNWITQMYHTNPNRPFKKVVFRLPKREEWNLAVYGTNPNDTFPWGASYLPLPKKMKINNGNYKKPHLKPVDAKGYQQGKLGLYHAFGNVSEMINQRGDCIGGNFSSDPYFFRRDAPNEFYPAYVPCPLVGLRVFMEVIEE